MCACCLRERSNPRRPHQAMAKLYPALQGARSPLRPPGDAVDASSILFVVWTTTIPPWTQDSIRVGGSPFPDRDFHLVRDAKLSWRDNAAPQPRPEAAAQRRLE